MGIGGRYAAALFVAIGLIVICPGVGMCDYPDAFYIGTESYAYASYVLLEAGQTVGTVTLLTEGTLEVKGGCTGANGAITVFYASSSVIVHGSDFQWNGEPVQGSTQTIGSGGTLTGTYGSTPFSLVFAVSVGDIVLVLESGLEVDIDIKPGSVDNSINIDGNGVIPVAILGSEQYPVTSIVTDAPDAYPILLNGSALRVRGKNPGCHIEDVSGPDGVPDGIPDLMCQFLDEPSKWQLGQTEAAVTWYVAADPPTQLTATDSVTIVKYTDD